MPIVKLRPPYKHLVNKPLFCGPSCIQIALFRRGFWIDQEQIAFEMHTAIIKGREYPYLLKHKVVSGKIKKETGLPFEAMGGQLNKFFKKHRLRLKSEIFYASQINKPKEFVTGNLKEGNDIIVNFWLRHKEPEVDTGHFMLISDINTTKNAVTLCDSWGLNKSFWKIDINEMLHRMDRSWDGNERGFVVISTSHEQPIR